ncbi:Retrovirus-related Pol polyprotein from transposon RE2-like protein [Drosera capensis]
MQTTKHQIDKHMYLNDIKFGLLETKLQVVQKNIFSKLKGVRTALETLTSTLDPYKNRERSQRGLNIIGKNHMRNEEERHRKRSRESSEERRYKRRKGKEHQSIKIKVTTETGCRLVLQYRMQTRAVIETVCKPGVAVDWTAAEVIPKVGSKWTANIRNEMVEDMSGLPGTVYCLQGFEDPEHPEYVYRLDSNLQALYRLKQAPRAWYKPLSTFLCENKFERGKVDTTLFLKKHKEHILLVQIINEI